MSSKEGTDTNSIAMLSDRHEHVPNPTPSVPNTVSAETQLGSIESQGLEALASDNNEDETSKLELPQIRDAVNIASQMIALSVSLITCPVHEQCDGSCSGPSVVFSPISIGNTQYKLRTDRPKMNLPLQQEHPIEIPTAALEYSAIDSEAGEIRLIHVQSAVFHSDPIVIDLMTVKFGHPEMPKYAALSYHWGKPVFDHFLISEGKKLQINESLHNCLKRHRQDKLEKPHYLWVDAICINQKDSEELVGQILQMRKIYQTAEVVFVDFGNTTLQFYFAYDLLYRLKIASNILKEHLKDGVEIRDYISRHDLLPSLEGQEWGILRQLFTSSWLKRTWTIQEVTLARDVRCRYGRFNFEWESLVHAFEFQSNQPQSINWSARISLAAQLGLANFYRLVLIGMDYKLKRLKPLQLLWRTRDCEVSNPRDKVIALLGLFPGRFATFRPDYTVSPEMLFHRFTVHVLQSYMFTSEQASILSYAGLHRRVLSGHLPSWAPDWTSLSTEGPVVFATIREQPYSCAGKSVPMLQSFGDGGAERNMLASRSLLVGKTLYLTSNCDLDGDHETEVERIETYPQKQWLKWHNEIVELVSKLRATEGRLSYPDVDDALARTLLADDTYAEGNATHNTSPILDPKKAYAEAIAQITTGDRDLRFTTPAGLFKTQTLTVSRQRRFAVTDTGFMGLVPSCTEIGDEIYILGGVTVPYVLRACRERIMAKTQKFQLIGDSYVHGVMDGELIVEEDGAQDRGGWSAVILV
ncbi:hypothetical protein GLAREA_04881 [Glarea lozoyensis ATCC 20868]|uniref:Heterokaryon incompatibility domain-containing protein n=1 Tax=Glarea lozoyensis (strain ATCC 20868 / MF5171) TaxID=1116229 RepID=S3CQY8_GLAL2|nr:uncharacterized protein GLAREA_04881 [Glarea lozoyensis ATCC 20868]EPE28090.1 hypothetical protein GLAREA_04881 [Glarea lozoyensis ATCC 20868]